MLPTNCKELDDVEPVVAVLAELELELADVELLGVVDVELDDVVVVVLDFGATET